MTNKYTIDYIKKNNLILLEAISGSHAYGTNIETSDLDMRGVYIMEEDDYLGMNHPDECADDRQDIKYLEIGKFISLLLTNNPNLIEQLGIPQHLIKIKHPLFDSIKLETFLSQRCKYSFGAYAEAQIKKARGLNKKIVNPMSKEKKGILDFCYVLKDAGSIPFKNYIDVRSKQEYFGLSAIDHMKDFYVMYYDYYNDVMQKPSKYNGILKDEEHTQLLLSSIPKEVAKEIQGYLYFNEDGYKAYCKQYKEYWEWDKKKNPVRYQDNIANDKNYDSKNMLHCVRLLEMAKEIALEKKIIVQRPNRDFLLSIRRGEQEYEELLSLAERLKTESDEAFDNSDLPKYPNYEEANKILINIRKEFYKERRNSIIQ